jgi:apolipoprotein N-acyltransferase
VDKFLKKIPFSYFFAGACYALSFPFYEHYTLFPLIFVAAAIYFTQFFKDGITARTVFINTLFFLWGYNCFGYYWLTFTLNEFGGLFFPLNFITWQFFTLIIAPQFYIFIIIALLLKKLRPRLFAQKNPYAISLLALVYTLLEYYTPQQFPAHFGHTWLVFAPYLKFAQFFGVPFFTFITIILGLEARVVITKRKIHPTLVLTLLFALINFVFMSIPSYSNQKEVPMRLVQANIGNDLKLKSEQGVQLAASQVVETFKELSLKNIKEAKPELIIWPETSYPKLLKINLIKHAPTDLSRIVRSSRTPFFLGTYDMKDNAYNEDYFETQYNTATLLSSNAEFLQTYHKRILIPFGEGLPFGPLNKYFAKIIKNISFFAKGEESTQFKLNDYSFISLICYEVLFPEYVRGYLNDLKTKPNFMINLTNDSWYGRYSEQEQHLFLSKWRAIEFNLPIIRSTNTGISTYIENNGLENKRLGNYVQDIMDFKLKIENTDKTLYQQYGILMFLIFATGFFSVLGLLRKTFFK